MRKTNNPIGVGIFVTLMVTMLLPGCAESPDMADNAINPSEQPPMNIEIAVDGDDGTRGSYHTGAGITEYSVYTFLVSNGRAYQQNIISTKNNDGSWSRTKSIVYPGTQALNMYALKPGWNYTDNPIMTPTEKSFEYTIPEKNKDQNDFMFSSVMNKTKANTNNTVKFAFKHMFSYLRLLAKLTIKDADVTVHSVTIHNLKSSGKFTFGDTEKSGSWEIFNDKYSNYTYDLPRDTALVYNKNITVHGTDSMLFVMPQVPTFWDPKSEVAEQKTIAYANTNKLAYISVKCRIRKQADGEYVGSTATSWATVYFPLATTTAWTNARIPYSGSYNVIITFNGGYTINGEDFLEANNGSGLEVVSDESLSSGIAISEMVEDANNGTAANTLSM